MRRGNKGIFLKVSRGKRVPPLRQKKRWRFFKINFKKLGIFLGAISLIIIAWLVYYYFGETLSFSFQPHTTEKIVSPNGSQNSLGNLKNVLAEKNISVTDIKTAPDGESVSGSLPGDIMVTFSLGKDIKWQVSTLQQLLEELTIDTDQLGNKKIAQIDFRFDKPIIKFK